MRVSTEIQTDLIDLSHISPARSSLTVRLDSLYASVMEYSDNKDENLIFDFTKELQSIIKGLVRIESHLIEDCLRQTIKLTDVLENIVRDIQTTKSFVHILFNSSTQIREYYIQHLESTKNYNQQRIELSKLLQVYEDYKRKESLRFSQEMKRLMLAKNLRSPIPEGIEIGLLSRILNEHYELETSKTYEQGVQTELTSFRPQEESKINLATYSSQKLTDDLEALNAKYLGKVLSSGKRRYEAKKAYADLSHRAYEVLREAKKAHNISREEYLSLLDDALEIQKFYISILNQTGHVEHSLYNALRRATQLFTQYYEEIKKTDLIDGAKEWLFSLVTSMQMRTSNMLDSRACSTVMSTSCTSYDEKMRANCAVYDLMYFNGSYISASTANSFAQSDLNSIFEILKQGLKNLDWLDDFQLRSLIETSSYYLVQVFNHLFPGTSFHDNWIYAIDIHANQETYLETLSGYLGTIFESPANMLLLSDALDLFHRFKLYQLDRWISRNPSLQENKFLEFQRFTISFRNDAYKYLLQAENINSNDITKDFENILFSEYSSQYIVILVKEKQLRAPVIIHDSETMPEQSLAIEETCEIQDQPKQMSTASTKKSKNKEKDDIWQEISKKYNLRQTFNFTESWKTLRFEIKIDLEKEKHQEAVAKIEAFLAANKEPALTSDDISLKYSVFSALGNLLEICILLEDIKRSWSILDELYTYLVPYKYTYLRNAQNQQIATQTAHIYILESKLHSEESSEYEDLKSRADKYFKKAANKAKELNMLCFSALMYHGLENLDINELIFYWKKLIANSDVNAPMDEYQLLHFFHLFNDLAVKLIDDVSRKIDREHREKLIERKSFQFQPERYEDLMNALNILDCLKNYCLYDSYLKRLQAQSCFYIYTSLCTIIRHPRFYNQAISYGNLAEEYAIDSVEKDKFAAKTRDFKTIYKQHNYALSKFRLFARTDDVNSGVTIESIEQQLSVDDNLDTFMELFNKLQDLLFATQINYLFLTLREGFNIVLSNQNLLNKFIDSIGGSATLLSAESYCMLLKLDAVYKNDYATAQKDNQPTAEALENRLKIYFYYNNYLSFAKTQASLGENILGLTDFDNQDIESQQRRLKPQIEILKNLLKIEKIEFNNTCFLRNPLNVDTGMLNRISAITYNAKKLPGDYLNTILGAYHSAHYWAFLKGLKDLLSANISKSHKIPVYYLIAAILYWIKELLHSEQYSNIFMDRTTESEFLEIQSYFAKSLLQEGQGNLKNAIKIAIATNDPSLDVLTPFLDKVEAELSNYLETECKAFTI